MFVGFVTLEETFPDLLQVADNFFEPYAPDAPPDYTVFSASGQVGRGGTAVAVDGQLGLYLAAVACTGADGFAVGPYWIRYAWQEGGQDRVALHAFVVT